MIILNMDLTSLDMIAQEHETGVISTVWQLGKESTFIGIHKDSCAID